MKAAKEYIADKFIPVLFGALAAGAVMTIKNDTKVENFTEASKIIAENQQMLIKMASVNEQRINTLEKDVDQLRSLHIVR